MSDTATTPSPPRRPGPALCARLFGVLLGAVVVAVAFVVAFVVGDEDHSTAGGTPTAQTVQVHLQNMRISPATITVPAGARLTLLVTNDDRMTHDLYVEGRGQTPMLGPGQHARLDVGVVQHALQGWCTVPGHRAAGMTMQITVSRASSSSQPSSTLPSSTLPSGAETMPAMPGMSDGASATAPPAGWQPRDPALAPAPAAAIHHVTFTVRDTKTEVAPGITQTLWTYNGAAPGPILHGHVGDRFVAVIPGPG